MTEQEIETWKEKIDGMSQTEMARLWRFGPVGHPVFITGSVLHEHFNKRFQGFTPKISKEIGWIA